MVYVDEENVEIENVDLSRGYLEDIQWIDHPQVTEKGHYEYEELEGGGRLQRYIVDVPYKAAWREVTVKRYVSYTKEELEQRAKGDYAARLDALEAMEQKQEKQSALLNAQIVAVSERGDFVEDVIAEMAGIVYG